MFNLTIETDNAAFEEDKAAEVERILQEVASRLRQGHDEGNVRDINGNTVGSWRLK